MAVYKVKVKFSNGSRTFVSSHYFSSLKDADLWIAYINKYAKYTVEVLETGEIA